MEACVTFGVLASEQVHHLYSAWGMSPLTSLSYFVSNAKKPSCFFPIPQAADCITRVVERANTPVIYLSTDAAESETGLLQSLIMLNGKPVPLVKRPAHNSAEKWDALLYRHGLGGDSQVRLRCSKLPICWCSDKNYKFSYENPAYNGLIGNEKSCKKLSSRKTHLHK